MAGFDLYPAIDLRDGRCVRLYQGDYGQETVYGDDPVAQARAFAAAGAPWIHVVDLDAARTGDPRNREVVAAIAAAVDVPVQTGGGCARRRRPPTRCSTPVSGGSSSAPRPWTTPTGCAGSPPATPAGWRSGSTPGAATSPCTGWTEGSGRDLVDVARSFADAGVAALVVTEIGRDGTLAGPDVDQLSGCWRTTQSDVVASGGVGTLDHVADARGTRGRGPPPRRA